MYVADTALPRTARSKRDVRGAYAALLGSIGTAQQCHVHRVENAMYAVRTRHCRAVSALPVSATYIAFRTRCMGYQQCHVIVFRTRCTWHQHCSAVPRTSRLERDVRGISTAQQCSLYTRSRLTLVYGGQRTRPRTSCLERGVRGHGGALTVF